MIAPHPGESSLFGLFCCPPSLHRVWQGVASGHLDGDVE